MTNSNDSNNILNKIGNTPLLHLKHFSQQYNSNIYAKAEFFNPGGSIKDRIGLSMILAAQQNGKLYTGATIIEPTSGNTGIAIAWIGAVLGYRVILVMPETMSVERRSILKAYGAEIVLSPGKLGMRGAITRANELLAEIKNSITLGQFENMANPEIHYKTTAVEIWQATGGHIDYFVAGVGTGGTISGVGKFLKEKNKNIKIVAVEPKDSPVLSGGNPGPHLIQGIGAGFIPAVYNREVVDEIITVSAEDAISTARSIANKEGALVGISSGANLWATTQLASRATSNSGNKKIDIITIFCDTGERYLSTPLFS
ncbi:MAG: cysteine synthase A [Bdellovibrionales bacterium RIFOXYD12_FULL_39_22]|nr:MAG: cysteine synthase A [Bdellovibrionales bacterium RIFOXYB1_FULL_39_21]OFZ42005.1 MAG: cysteine synthase A [Bdellovibrionales bacterium RIFOXYC12_FULL_39_17]OFZ50721.1 MAG: cysteine synthase A [Bdellovibrionales bacterium RIFOXYC1_FULL_39_130]OFZ77944.1 MAG: cysteine synthase A [Bdellovibrionales bacterium RIFOXYD1_FULL_39_84]OFZ93620.1 MAG: cysteine synthase A [Bdellovibrionales bacterium RIFOXYD12_FULL_39_22]HLE10253.1 cysteine synthase A [Bacteriovoracaceae bacterium]